MNWVCSTQGGEENGIQVFGEETLTERGQLQQLSVDVV